MAAIRTIMCGEKHTYTKKTFQGETDQTVANKVGIWWTDTKTTRYEGEVKLTGADAQAHGAGTMFTSNGGRYDGHWSGGLRSKFGIAVTPAGAVYAGEWSNDTRTGFGVNFSADGDVYHGQFDRDMEAGFGDMDRLESEGDPKLRETGLWIQSGTEVDGVQELKPERGRDGRFPNKERAITNLPHVRVAVHKAVEQAQMAVRSQLRAQDAQLKAVLALDIEADDGSGHATRIANATSEAKAAESLSHTKRQVKRKLGMEMADLYVLGPRHPAGSFLC